MTRDQFEKIFEEDSSRWDGDNALHGLLILSQYFDIKKESILIGAEHDIIYGPDVDKVVGAGISEVDAKELRRLNWMIYEDGDCLACFI